MSYDLPAHLTKNEAVLLLEARLNSFEAVQRIIYRVLLSKVFRLAQYIYSYLLESSLE